MDKLLSRKEAWERLGISISGLNKLVSTGQLRVHRIGSLVKISEFDLQAYLDSVAVGGNTTKTEKN
jgi:excisionase family DNA binding protein